jgi:hypothetical protein
VPEPGESAFTDSEGFECRLSGTYFRRIEGAAAVSGFGWLDGLARQHAVLILLRIALVVRATLRAYFVLHTGDLGVKGVWKGRRSGGGPGGGGGPVNQLFGPGGG